MSVLLCDGNVYNIDINEINFDECLFFFENGHIEDYLSVYENRQYKGIITYKSIMRSKDLSNAIISDRIFIGDNLWEDARNIFENDEEKDAIAVFSQSNEMIYIARYDKKSESEWKRLNELQKYVDKKLWESFCHYTNRVHIKGINEVLFQLRIWLRSLDSNVSVEGEAWEAFGIKEFVNTEDNLIVIDEKSDWLNSLYLEYRKWLEKYSTPLKEVLCKPYVQKLQVQKKVLFYLTEFVYFTNSIKPLIFRYIQSDMECILVFPLIEKIMNHGPVTVQKIVEMAEELELAGAKCHTINERTLYDNEYVICFLSSEYSQRLPNEFRRSSKYVVSIQVTALYTHMYQIKGRFEQVFSEQAKAEIDYLVASEYVADWICSRDDSWGNKILRFGYPKLDALYHSMKNNLDIPYDWRERIAGKKVFLFTTYNMEQSWLDFFADASKKMVAIWRPHPQKMTTAEGQAQIKKISENYNILIDSMPSYGISFKVSDALIAALNSSVMINYLYTGKPICLFGGEKTFQQAVIDYREELWYKCMYATSDKDNILKFINKIYRGEKVIDVRQTQYLKRILQNFDGKVCDRIYDYFHI